MYKTKELQDLLDDYIKNDIEEKKALFEVLPHNTEIRRKIYLTLNFSTSCFKDSTPSRFFSA